MRNPKKITEFDTPIQDAHRSFALPFDWRLLKAQLIAESGLNPRAVSPVGARGLGQFMPDAWREKLAAQGMDASTSPFDAKASIRCAGFYMRWLVRQWASPRPAAERYKLALASYNAGIGNILAAQKLAMSNRYSAIMAQLPKVTGAENARQTSTYVERIFSIWAELSQD